jgi:hypothetical protein
MTDYLDLAKSVCVEPRLLAEQLERQAVTAATGASAFGPLPFMAACLREEAEYVRQHGPRPLIDAWRDPEEAANEP